MLLIKLRPTL